MILAVFPESNEKYLFKNRDIANKCLKNYENYVIMWIPFFDNEKDFEDFQKNALTNDDSSVILEVSPIVTEEKEKENGT